MLISRNTGLKSLELNISTTAAAFAPPIGSLCKILYAANWQSLKELIIKFSLYGSSHPVINNADTTEDEDLPGFGEILTRFLSSHPTIEILRLSSGSLLPPLPPLNLTTSGTSGSTYASTELEEAYLAMPAPYCMFISPQLPDTALPNLKTFEGSCVEDLKIICRPQASRHLTTLPAVEGWIIPEPTTTAATLVGDGLAGTSSANPSTPPPSTTEISPACQITISNLAKTLANLQKLSGYSSPTANSDVESICLPPALLTIQPSAQSTTSSALPSARSSPDPVPQVAAPQPQKGQIVVKKEASDVEESREKEVARP